MSHVEHIVRQLSAPVMRRHPSIAVEVKPRPSTPRRPADLSSARHPTKVTHQQIVSHSHAVRPSEHTHFHSSQSEHTHFHSSHTLATMDTSEWEQLDQLLEETLPAAITKESYRVPPGIGTTRFGRDSPVDDTLFAPPTRKPTYAQVVKNLKRHQQPVRPKFTYAPLSKVARIAAVPRHRAQREAIAVDFADAQAKAIPSIAVQEQPPLTLHADQDDEFYEREPQPPLPIEVASSPTQPPPPSSPSRETRHRWTHEETKQQIRAMHGPPRSKLCLFCNTKIDSADRRRLTFHIRSHYMNWICGCGDMNPMEDAMRTHTRKAKCFRAIPAYDMRSTPRCSRHLPEKQASFVTRDLGSSGPARRIAPLQIGLRLYTQAENYESSCRGCLHPNRRPARTFSPGWARQ